MSKISGILAACATSMLCCGAVFAQDMAVTTGSAPGMRLKAGEVEIRAKVVELDMARRTATLRSEQGEVVTIDVPESVKNFDQARLGDVLVVRYRAALLVKLEPASPGSARERVESTTIASAPKGELPAAEATRTVTVLAMVTQVDRKGRTVTLRGARRTVTAHADVDVDLARIKVGQEVRAEFVESLVANVERATP
jgi:hypothetical protein